MSELVTTDAELPATHNLQTLVALVGSASALFYWAETDENPAVKTYWDALHYISTSLSVGYANYFPVTQVGKTIAAVVQMLGPALSAKALDGLITESPPSDPAMLAKLDAILEELRLLNAGRSNAAPALPDRDA